MEQRIIATSHGSVGVRDSGGYGPSVLFIHGNSLNAELFAPMLARPILSPYRLVSFDLPGHGSSPRAHDPGKDYGLLAYAEIVRELTEALGLGAPLLFGHSLGGHIAMQALAGGLDARGLFLLGTPPLGTPPDYAAAFNLAAAGDWIFRDKLSPAEIERTAASCMPPGISAPAELRRAIAETDPRARLELGASMGRDSLHDEAGFLSAWDRPVAVAVGRHDTFINLSYIEALSIPTLWRGAIQRPADAGHCPQIDQPDMLAAMLADFLDEAAR